MGSGRPLEGLRVIDLGTRIAAPFCAGLLGEMGAEIIKIEQPRGDFMRELGPFHDGQSMFWSVEGRGRKSVTLDLRKPEGQEILRRLAATADVVVENFRPGTLEGWNIGPAQLDPRLVIVRISVFGQDGPSSQRTGLDRLGIGYGGLLHLTGYPDSPPVRVGVTMSDYLTGVFAAHAAIAALYERDARGTGEGAVVDAFLYGGVMRILEWTFVAYDKLGLVREREGNTMSNSVPIDNYPTADGKFVCIVAGSDQNFRRLARAMDREELSTDPRYATLAARVERHAEVNGLVAEWTRTLPTAEIEARCIAQDVPVATAYTAADIFADPHMQVRGDLVTVEDPVLGPVKQQAPFPRFVGAPPNVPTGAPGLGEHTDEVLGEILGLSESDRAKLREAKVI